MNEWWDGLTAINQGFYMAAVFFGVFFVWQLISVLLGLSTDDSDMDADVDADADFDHDGTYDEFEHGAETDAAETVSAFKLLSLRSIVTFFTLFSLGGALYMDNDLTVARSLTLATIWGLAGMICVAGIFCMLKKLAETGTAKIATCVGASGTVYLDIPTDGLGEVKVTVSNISSHVKARGIGGKAFSANTPIRVVRLIGPRTVEVTEEK
jgi:hypothetical protein